MKRFKAGINRYYEALKVEIKGGLTKTPLHLLKTVVIFFIPFFYAFTYLWAFYDPISKTNDLDLTVVTSKDDAVGEFVRVMTSEKGIKIHNGPNVNISAKLKHIYSDDKHPITEDSDVVKDSLMTINVPDMDHLIVTTLRKAIYEYNHAKGSAAAADNQLNALVQTIAQFLGTNTLDGKASTEYNYKKNFLIGFATDVSSAQSGGLNEVLNMLIKAINWNGSNNIIANMVKGNVDASGNTITGEWIADDGKSNAPMTKPVANWMTTATSVTSPIPTQQDFVTFATAMKKHFDAITNLVDENGGYIQNANSPNPNFKGISIINLHSQLGTDGKQDFGIGLSPFFISIGMWFGAVAMTVLIHRKIYDRKTYVKWRYMAKGTLINVGVIIQACVLMIALKFIGLDIIGNNHWAIMFGTAIFAGIVFANFIMAIRLSIPSRALSIYIVVIFMVLNIVCSGGLFPVQTQNSFVRAMNTWLPMHFSVEMLRQGLVDTDWATWGAAFGYLSIYLLFVPIGMGFNLIYTHRWYLRYEYKMPKHMQDYHDWWLKTNMERRHGIMKRLKKAGRKQKRGGEV